MTLQKTIDGVNYIYSETQGKMIPKSVYGTRREVWGRRTVRFDWCESDEVYYSEDTEEEYLYYDDAIDNMYLLESEAISAVMRWAQ